MAINFPNNPAVNDTFTVGGTTFTFTGVKWETSAVVELNSDTTPSLGGDLDGGAKNINNVGVITATTFSGNLYGNADTATTATYAETAGISTYATTAGVSTNAQGLTGDPNIQVTNATVLGNLDVQGTTTTIDTAVTEVDSLNVEGNVGIGTDNPTARLQVYRATQYANNPIIQARSNNGSTNELKFEIDGDGDAYFNGNLGIGTDNPDGKLAVVGNGYNQINIANNNTANTNKLGGVTSQNYVGDKWSIIQTYSPSGSNQIYYGSADGSYRGATSHYFYVNSSPTATTGHTEALRINSSGNVVATGTISDSKGGLRDIPLNDESTNASYTLVASDAGKVVHAHSTTTTVVVPNSVFSVGNVVTILNGGTSNISISQGTGFSLRNSGDGSSGSRTLAQFGMATIYFTSASIGYISGSNMT